MFKTSKYHLAIFIAALSYLAVTLSCAPLMAATTGQIQKIVSEEAKRQGIVPPSLALAVARVESNFRADALSKAGARGVMQIMPLTASDEFGVNKNELWEPRLNVRLGITYLNRLYKQYGNKWELALSHYNGGTLRGYGANARPHSYTRKYVNTVFHWARIYERRDTKLALANQKAPSLKPSSRIFQRAANAYWSEPTQAIQKDWRHYLKISSDLLKTKISDTRPQASNLRDWQPFLAQSDDNSPSTRLMYRLEKSRLNFKYFLQNEKKLEQTMQGARSPRFM
jgi:hypothetical protein